MTINDAAKYFLSVRNQVHLWHWQTEIDSEHKALGDFYEAWLPLVDQFVENYSAMNGRPKGPLASGIMMAYAVGEPLKYMTGVVQYLLTGEIRTVSTDSDMQNLLDEMVSLAKNTVYRLTLKKVENGQ